MGRIKAHFSSRARSPSLSHNQRLEGGARIWTVVLAQTLLSVDSSEPLSPGSVIQLGPNLSPSGLRVPSLWKSHSVKQLKTGTQQSPGTRNHH